MSNINIKSDMGRGNNYIIVRIPSNSELKKFLAYNFNSFDFNGTITDRKITFNMHKNPIGDLENTFPQDNSMDNYGDYYVGFRDYGYPQKYVPKSNIGRYVTTAGEIVGTMTLVRPMIEYKE